MAENKVRFGLKNVHAGLYTETTAGAVTLGTPMAVPGAVRMNLEPNSEEVVFYADDIRYYVTYSDDGFNGELEMALFSDEFKTTFLNYVALADGGIAHVKTMQTKPMYIAFEGSGDAEGRRGIVYNLTPGQIQREHKTIEGTKEPVTETLPFMVAGILHNGITRVSYGPTSAVYNTIFENPPVPVLPGASE